MESVWRLWQELADLGSEVAAESQRYAVAIAALQQRYETARSEGLTRIEQVQGLGFRVLCFETARSKRLTYIERVQN